MRPQLTSASSRLVFAFAVLLSVIEVGTPQASAQTFSVVHNFTGGNGGVPFNGLTVGASTGGGSHTNTPGHGETASFYGTTSTGGSSNYGVVFSMNPNGSETIIHNFTGGNDGAAPYGVLIIDKAGNLYGTTTAGGSADAGTVFEISGNTESVLYSFGGGANGADPVAGLVQDAAGNLYGTTSQGGTNGNGTVFELAIPQTKGGPWTQTVLYSFGTGTDGTVPVGGVSFDSAGNLYGTTSEGGADGNGTVFQLVPGARWTENILHSFQNGNDGSVPYAGLIADKSGNFYGAATQGGANGGGTVFELTGSGSNWNFSVIYSVPGWGISGTFRNVVLDSSGNLYGTTHCDGSYNSGTVYELTPSGGNWKDTLLYTFTGGTDGLYSVSNLVSSQNKLYGTTLYGGSNNNGVVYEVTP